MTRAANASPLSQMLNNALSKFDRNGDNKLAGEELADFNEILKPGVAADDNGRPTVDMNERLDHNGDASVDRDEMISTGFLMPGAL